MAHTRILYTWVSSYICYICYNMSDTMYIPDMQSASNYSTNSTCICNCMKNSTLIEYAKYNVVKPLQI